MEDDMRASHVFAASVALLVALAGAPLARASAAGQDPAPIPPWTRLSGTIPGAKGSLAVTFAIYADQTGGDPLWIETQNVVLDSEGRYNVFLGATQPNGIPAELFGSGSARWVGVRAEGAGELPRVLLVSVPYAVRAATADAIGGLPLSAFVLAGDTSGKAANGLTYLDSKALNSPPPGASAPLTAGTAGYIAKFTDVTNLNNSLIFQSGANIGINTTAPAAPFNPVSTVAPGTFFDVYSNTLTALPVVFRAARGTPIAPAAVQTDDILGGLAVRGYGATGFSAGTGQVMYRAAEPWTDTAHGTYLSVTTTPLGSATWVERMRVAPNGFVGHGTSAPLFPLDVRLVRGVTYARFGADGTMPLFLMAGSPHVGFNTYFDTAFKYGSAGPAGYLGFNNGVAGGFVVATAPSGTSDAAATMTPRMAITNDGKVGIGTTAPTVALDVAGDVNASGAVVAAVSLGAPGIVADWLQANSDIAASYALFSTAGSDYWAVKAESLGTGSTVGIDASVGSTTGVAGKFTNAAATGKAISASVNGVEVMSASEAGIKAGPGMTGTPIACGAFDGDATRRAGSSNIACTWNASSTRYQCTIDGQTFVTTSYVANVAQTALALPVISAAGGQLVVQFYNVGATPAPIKLASADVFYVTVYKQ
jgi:hypothetical protein